MLSLILDFQVTLLFEVEDLAVASPATVSRCGMVYTDYADMGWQPYVSSWLDKKPNKVGTIKEQKTERIASSDMQGNKFAVFTH